MLLSFFDPQTLNKSISLVVRCNNPLFQRCQDQRSWTIPTPQANHLSTIKTIQMTSKNSQGPKDIQIDVLLFTPLIAKEKK